MALLHARAGVIIKARFLAALEKTGVQRNTPFLLQLYF
jgi:hypothetical protein